MPATTLMNAIVFGASAWDTGVHAREVARVRAYGNCTKRHHKSLRAPMRARRRAAAGLVATLCVDGVGKDKMVASVGKWLHEQRIRGVGGPALVTREVRRPVFVTRIRELLRLGVATVYVPKLFTSKHCSRAAQTRRGRSGPRGAVRGQRRDAQGARAVADWLDGSSVCVTSHEFTSTRCYVKTFVKTS
jgi:hypothetical protein